MKLKISKGKEERGLRKSIDMSMGEAIFLARLAAAYGFHKEEREICDSQSLQGDCVVF